MKTPAPKRHTLGTMSLISNTGQKARQTYVNYKIRGEVETMIDENSFTEE